MRVGAEALSLLRCYNYVQPHMPRHYNTETLHAAYR